MTATQMRLGIAMLITCPLSFAQSRPSLAIDDRDIDVVTFEDAQYPPLAYNAHIQGTVVVQVKYDDQGAVVNATAISGPLVLIAASLDNVKKWLFKPTASKTAVILYNYKILDGRCNHNSSFFILQGTNVATIIACPGLVNPSAPNK